MGAYQVTAQRVPTGQHATRAVAAKSVLQMSPFRTAAAELMEDWLHQVGIFWNLFRGQVWSKLTRFTVCSKQAEKYATRC
jgi:hypothetical protein